MNVNIDILKKINWFLKPISDLILFLFTTKLGLFILLISVFVYIFIKIKLRIKQYQLLNQAAYGDDKISISTFLGLVSEELSAIITKVISNLTIILVVIISLLILVGLSNSISSFTDYIDNQKRINELKTTLKNLNQRYKVAEIKILNYDRTKDQTTFTIKYFDYSKENFTPARQKITIDGSVIYFLNFVMNFDYSAIETGENINLAFPIKIFSNKVSQDEGIQLNIKDTLGIPYIYKRSQKNLYGIDSLTYLKRVKELVELIQDPEKARLAGIRGFNEVAPHNIRYPRKGQTFIIWIEQSGGMTIKRAEDW